MVEKKFKNHSDLGRYWMYEITGLQFCDAVIKPNIRVGIRLLLMPAAGLLITPLTSSLPPYSPSVDLMSF